jgi:hypothetical protein
VLNKTENNFFHDVEIKNEEEIELMREACQIARKALDFAEKLIAPEITTDEIDKKVHQFIVKIEFSHFRLIMMLIHLVCIMRDFPNLFALQLIT